MHRPSLYEEERTNSTRRRAATAKARPPTIVSLTLLAVLSVPGVVASHGGTTHSDWIEQGETHEYNGELVCPQVPTEKVVSVLLLVWAPGDVVTLTVEAAGGPVSATTSGIPPGASIAFESPQTCAVFAVHGSQVLLADYYTVSES